MMNRCSDFTVQFFLIINPVLNVFKLVKFNP